MASLSVRTLVRNLQLPSPEAASAFLHPHLDVRLAEAILPTGQELHLPTAHDCSCRAACPIVISPEITDNTSLSFSSVAITGSLLICYSLQREPDSTTLPRFLKRDKVAISLGSDRRIRLLRSRVRRRRLTIRPLFAAQNQRHRRSLPRRAATVLRRHRNSSHRASPV